MYCLIVKVARAICSAKYARGMIRMTDNLMDRKPVMRLIADKLLMVYVVVKGLRVFSNR